MTSENRANINTTAPAATKAAPKSQAGGRPGPLRLFMNNRLAFMGLVCLLVITTLAVLTPILPLQPPHETDPANRLKAPLEMGFILGSDHLGRDILSRVLWGTQISLLVGCAATLVAAFFGALIGLVAGYAGGWVDNVLMRGIDMIMAFPYILLALAIVAVLGPGLMNALLAISVVNIPFFARNIRGVVIAIAHKEYVQAARMAGKSHGQIVLTEILPNALPTLVITMSTTVGWMILETAGLSFLGLGAQPPQADLGSMLGEGRKLLFTAPHVSVIPGVMVFLLVMSLNLVGDGLRDVLDPRLKSGALSRPRAVTWVDRPAHVHQGAATQTPGTMLDVQNLATQFHIGDQVYPAVNQVSFSLAPGECLGLVGESGSGKSVTALSIMGLVATPPGRIVGGHVFYQNEDVLAADARHVRALRGRRVAYVFQDPLSTLHPLFTIGEQIVEAIRAHQPLGRAEAWQHAVALLDKVHMPNAAERAKAYPHELSGGMRQRVCIAMALANQADVLIADEPTTALDVTVQAQILSLLKHLQARDGLSILFITHDMGVVAELCDRVAVMYAGKIVETGPAEHILARPAHPYTRKLMACTPVLGQRHKKLQPIPGLPPVLNNLPAGCAFAPRCAIATEACHAAQDIPVLEQDQRHVKCLTPLDMPHDTPMDEVRTTEGQVPS